MMSLSTLSKSILKHTQKSMLFKPCASASFATSVTRPYRTSLKMRFDADGRFRVFHAEDGDQSLKRLTRINMFFVVGNSMLLIAEVMNPFFGYYHSLSLVVTVMASLIGSRMLDYYSTKMVSNIWLHRDGRTIEVDFMNAFFLPKSGKFMIRNFGNYQPSRLWNINCF